MAESESLGTARIGLTLDLSDYSVAIDRAKQQQTGLGAVAQQEADKMTVAQKRVIASLDQQITKLGLTREQWLQYKVITQTTGATQDALLTKIKANTVALGQEGDAAKKTGIQFNQYGLSAKQQVAAMRQVPAQITDIFTSLQGGQNPLTVLIQQGGQLKDVFGGVVPAARALGGALAKLVTPWSLLAGAIGVTGFAYLQSEQRANAFNAALIMSGNAATMNSDQLQAMAESLDNVTGVTTRQAADALTQIVAGGRIAADQYALVAEAAARMQDVTGKAMSDTIAEYAELARDPVSAILKFNDAENFLTETIYSRIKAMQDAGDIEGAAALATETRAQAQIERAQQVQDSLGLVSGAWFKIKQNTGEAWDEAVNYFSNLDRDAKEAAGTLSRMWQAFRTPGPAGAFAMMGATTGGPTAEDRQAAQQRQTARSETLRQLSALNDSNRSRKDRQELEEKQIVNLYKQLGISKEDKRVQDALAVSRARYNESQPKGKSGTSLANAQASASLQAIKDQLALEQAAIQNSTRTLQAEYGAKLITSADYYAKSKELLQRDTAAQEKALTDQIAFLRSRDVTGKDSVNTSKQIGEAEAKLAKVRADGATQLAVLGIQEDAYNKKRTFSINAYIRALDLSNEAAQRSVDAAVARIGMGDQEADQRERLARIMEDSANKERELADQFAQDNDQDAYDRRLAALQAFTDKRITIEVSGFDAIKAAQSDWLNGLNAGMQNWLDQTANIAGQVAAVTNRSMDTVADAFTEAASTGKMAWKDMLVSILKDVEKFLVKKAIMQVITAFAGSGMNSFGFQGGTDASFFAKGEVFSGSPTLSAHSGTVVNTPTLFAFAKGAGVMGEDGAEGIFPLSRGPDGKLGIKALGGAGGGDVISVGVNVTVNSDGSSTTETDASSNAGLFKEFGEHMRTIAQQEVQKSTRPGGLLWRAGVSTG